MKVVKGLICFGFVSILLLGMYLTIFFNFEVGIVVFMVYPVGIGLWILLAKVYNLSSSKVLPHHPDNDDKQ